MTASAHERASWSTYSDTSECIGDAPIGETVQKPSSDATTAPRMSSYSTSSARVSRRPSSRGVGIAKVCPHIPPQWSHQRMRGGGGVVKSIVGGPPEVKGKRQQELDKWRQEKGGIKSIVDRSPAARCSCLTMRRASVEAKRSTTDHWPSIQWPRRIELILLNHPIPSSICPNQTK